VILLEPQRLCLGQLLGGSGGRGLGRVEAEVGVVGQLGGPSAGALGQVAFGQGLQPPGDAAGQPDLVVAVGRLAEDLGVAETQLFDGHPPEGGDLFGDVQVHGVLLSRRLGDG
jgi:hypothetical protein